MSIPKDLRKFFNILKKSPESAELLLKKFSANHFSSDVQVFIQATTAQTLFQFLLQYNNEELVKCALAKMPVEEVLAQYDTTVQQNPKLRKPFVLIIREAEQILLESEQELITACQATPFSGLDFSAGFLKRGYASNEKLTQYQTQIEEIQSSLSATYNIPLAEKTGLVACLKELQKMSGADRTIVNICTKLLDSGKEALSHLQLKLMKVTAMPGEFTFRAHEHEKFLLDYYKFCMHTLYLGAEYALRSKLGAHMQPYVKYTASAYLKIKNNLKAIPPHLGHFLTHYFYLTARYYSQNAEQNFLEKSRNTFRACQEAFAVCEIVEEPLTKISILQIATALHDTTAISDPKAPIIFGEIIPTLKKGTLMTAKNRLEKLNTPILTAYLEAFLLKYEVEALAHEINKKADQKLKPHKTPWDRAHTLFEQTMSLFTQHLQELVLTAFMRPAFFDAGRLYHDNMLNPSYAALCLLDMFEQTAIEFLAILEEEAKPFQKTLDELDSIVRPYAEAFEKGHANQGLDIAALEKLDWRKYQAFVVKAERCYKLFLDSSRLRNILSEQHFFDLKRPELRLEELLHTEITNQKILRWSGGFQIIRLVLGFAAEHYPLEETPKQDKSKPKQKPAASTCPKQNRLEKAATDIARTDKKNTTVQNQQSTEESLDLFTLPPQQHNTIIKLCIGGKFYKAHQLLKTLYPAQRETFLELQQMLSLADIWAHCQHHYGNTPYEAKEAFAACCALQNEIIRRYPEHAQKTGLANASFYQDLFAYYEKIDKTNDVQEIIPSPVITQEFAPTKAIFPPPSVGRQNIKQTPKAPIKPHPEDIHIKRKKMDWRASSYISAEVHEVFEKLQKAGIRFFIYGGFVRDMYRKAVPKDIDLFIFASLDTLQKCFGSVFIQTSRYLTLGQIHLRDAEPIDVFYLAPISKTELDGILKTRYQQTDLTCNSLLFDWENNTLVYEQSALSDIDRGLLKLPKACDAKAHFKQDPIRMWRVLYFMLKLGYQPEESLQQAILDCRTMLAETNEDRRFIEFKKLCAQDYSRALHLLHTFGFGDLPCLQPLEPALITKLAVVPEITERLHRHPEAYLAILHAQNWLTKFDERHTDIVDFTTLFMKQNGLFERTQSQHIHLWSFIRIWQAFKSAVEQPSANSESIPDDLIWVKEVAKALAINLRATPRGSIPYRFFQPIAAEYSMAQNHHLNGDRQPHAEKRP